MSGWCLCWHLLIAWSFENWSDFHGCWYIKKFWIVSRTFWIFCCQSPRIVKILWRILICCLHRQLAGMVLSFSSVIVAALSIRFSMLFGSAWGITAPGLLWYLGGFYTVLQFSEPLLYISGCFLHVCNVGSEPSTCTDSNTELETPLSSPLSSVGFSAVYTLWLPRPLFLSFSG